MITSKSKAIETDCRSLLFYICSDIVQRSSGRWLLKGPSIKEATVFHS